MNHPRTLVQRKPTTASCRRESKCDAGATFWNSGLLSITGGDSLARPALERSGLSNANLDATVIQRTGLAAAIPSVLLLLGFLASAVVANAATTIRVVNAQFSAGQTAAVSVFMDAQAAEYAVGFTLQFDVSNPSVLGGLCALCG